MKAGIFFTGTGPILILTSHESFTDPNLVNKLVSKGIRRFIAYDVPEDKVKEKYGNQFKVVMKDLGQTDDLRVLDYDGHHVFYNFPLSELKDPSVFES